MPRRVALWICAQALDETGRLHPLSPVAQEHARHELDVNGILQLPVSSRRDHTPRGWSLAAVPGERVGIVLITSHERQLMLEGELRDRVALPRLQALAGLDKAPLDEHLVAAFGRFLEENGYAADTRTYCLDRELGTGAKVDGVEKPVSGVSSGN